MSRTVRTLLGWLIVVHVAGLFLTEPQAFGAQSEPCAVGGIASNCSYDAPSQGVATAHGLAYDSSTASTTPDLNLRTTMHGTQPRSTGAPGSSTSSISLSLATKVGAGLPALPARLAGGPKNVHVYRGIDENGEIVYSGITNDLKRRAAQHGDRFTALDPVTTSPVSRGEARAIEQALILRSRGQNQINAISPRHPYYDDAVKYGRAWLRDAGQ